MTGRRAAEPRSTSRQSRRRRGILWVALGALGAISIVIGFVVWSGTDAPPSAGPTDSRAVAPPTDAGTPPTAGDPLPRFAQVVDAAVARSSAVSGATLRSGLADHGYDASRVEYTSDRTSVGLAASAITVAYKDSDTNCLIAQVQTQDRATNYQARSPIASGTCLIGSTETSNPR